MTRPTGKFLGARPSARIASGVAGLIVALLFIVPDAGAATAQTITDAERAVFVDGLAQLDRELDAAEQAVAGIPALHALLPDVRVLAQTLDRALHRDGPFAPALLPTARDVLREGLERAAHLQQARTPWTARTGKVIRGWQSPLDDSIHPYVLTVPADWTPNDAAPRALYLECPHAGLVTELKVIDAGLRDGNGFADEKSFHIRAYTRGYNAAKFAGEVAIFEQLDHVAAHYRIDARRIAVHGFSMGGSGTWLLATHRPDCWVAAAPGAGFADTEHFVRLWDWKSPPPAWHRTLFRLYNATDVAGNLAMVPTFAYVGERDSHRFSHDAMARAMTRDGVPLRRVLGLETAHSYEKAARAEVAGWLRAAVTAGRPAAPREVRFATHTLRYDRCDWLRLDRLERHWVRGEVHARIEAPGVLRINTANVAAFTLEPPAGDTSGWQVELDGERLTAPAGRLSFHKTTRSWPPQNNRPRPDTTRWVVGPGPATPLAKVHGLTGPIDDAFMTRFLFVCPTGPALHPSVAAWVDTELARARAVWRTVYRGEARVKDDRDVTDADLRDSNLILWGDPSSNRLIARLLPQLPLTWTKDTLTFGAATYPASGHMPVLVYPNALQPGRYVVLNSGPTQRPGTLLDQNGSSTSALVTPKLPDFAIVDLAGPPDDRTPGGIVRTGFFDEFWQIPSSDTLPP